MNVPVQIHLLSYRKLKKYIITSLHCKFYVFLQEIYENEDDICVLSACSWADNFLSARLFFKGLYLHN
jgi:hypothetical protein